MSDVTGGLHLLASYLEMHDDPEGAAAARAGAAEIIRLRARDSSIETRSDETAQPAQPEG